MQQRTKVDDEIEFAVSMLSMFSTVSRLVSATNVLIYLQQMLFIDSRGSNSQIATLCIDF